MEGEVSNVVDFAAAKKEREETPTPMWRGRGKCLDCKHEWMAACPYLDDYGAQLELECPQCKTMRGVWMGQFAPAPGELLFICGCGAAQFAIIKTGPQCVGCGREHAWDTVMTGWEENDG